MAIQTGDKAPAFTLPDQDGKLVSLIDFIGHKVVLYTYPEDNTPTCTVEACNLRDNYAILREKGLVVIGVSPDTIAKHKKFESKHSLPFTLLADPERELLMAYDVYGEKKLYGRTYMGIFRRTFLINEAGIIEHIITTVRSKEHTEQIMKVWGID
ncbi:MAG: thioredoxin-dependent thiol peroxidase [Taibaiella sp.]|nr:thioredoxin-dependent thiol peroxidase [Taibaiella sp.]